jgi:hypothetical protein
MRTLFLVGVLLILSGCGQVPVETDVSKPVENTREACSQLILENNTVLFYCNRFTSNGLEQVQMETRALDAFRGEHPNLEPTTMAFHASGALAVTFKDRRSSF